jgi:putative membrane protein
MSIAAIGNYLAYAGGGLVLVLIGLTIYSIITPYHELKLIRAGNEAAAFSFGGTAIGLSIAIYSVAAHSIGFLDMIVWSAIAVVGQLIAFVLVAVVLTGFKQGIESGKTSYGIALGAFSIAVGLMNAGAVTT